MIIRLVTWNTCGKPTVITGDKCTILASSVESSIIGGYGPPVFCIQEAGTDKNNLDCKIFGKQYKFYSYQILSKLKDTRCNIALLVPLSLANDPTTKIYTITKGQISRPVVCIKIGSLTIANIHATSGKPGTACSEIVSAINSLMKDSGKKWILMGDMNIEPKDLQERKRFGGVSANVTIINSGYKTRRDSFHEYDYAIVPTELGKSVTCIDTLDCRGVSDHDAVEFNVDYKDSEF